jgi:hypothetical protein
LRPVAPDPVASDERQATGREKHDQKITVYLSAAELLELEHARLRLRRFGFVMDRGRLVREAIAILLADLDARGKDSLIARRIRATLDGQPGNGQSANGQPANGKAPPDGKAPSDDPDDTPSPLPSLAWPRMRAAR